MNLLLVTLNLSTWKMCSLFKNILKYWNKVLEENFYAFYGERKISNLDVIANMLPSVLKINKMVD